MMCECVVVQNQGVRKWGECGAKVGRKLCESCAKIVRKWCDVETESGAKEEDKVAPELLSKISLA